MIDSKDKISGLSNEEVTSTNDNKSEVFKIENVKLDLAGNGGTGGNKKMD